MVKENHSSWRSRDAYGDIVKKHHCAPPFPLGGGEEMVIGVVASVVRAYR